MKHYNRGMPVINRSALVSHSALEMYLLVCDIDSYPEFLPWCDKAIVSEQSERHQVATVYLDRRLQQSKFTTNNRLEAGRAIHMTLADGPFRHLEGSWTFTPISVAACRVELEIDFEFKSRVLAMLMGAAFSRVCDTLVLAFIQRANYVLDADTETERKPD
ncbi:MAG: type II toxin-antitoxin system RatA family toxin [Granulosicoccus sp.]